MASCSPRLARRVGDAAVSFEADRFDEARSILGPIAKETPDVAEVRELLGLTYYRLGRWRDAVRELEAFFALTSSTEQHPVLADSYRALGRHARVEELWSELREDSPSAELVHEGRIVSAGSLADQDRLADAIRLLEKGWKTPRQPKDHHLRRGFALADQGMDTRLIQDYLGHKNIRHTVHYTAGNAARFSAVWKEVREEECVPCRCGK